MRWPWLLAIWHLAKRSTNPMLRAVHRLESDQSDTLLQPYPDTEPDRHPALFAFARDALQKVDEPSVLSFGCSTGEEPITLASYFPRGRIHAIDINPHSLSIARGKAAQAGITSIAFSQGDQPPAKAAIYDVIFCLSVLRHGRLDAELPECSTAIFPYARYEAVVMQLDHCLKPGGLLIIWGSQYDFESATVAARYDPQMVPQAATHGGPVYSADDRLLHCNGLQNFVFKKRGMVAEEGYLMSA
jgi:SAM-dependent methyltransferase